MTYIEDLKKPESLDKEWKVDEILKLKKESDQFRSVSKHTGKKYLSNTGLHNFLKSRGALSKFSTPREWIISGNKKQLYTDLINGLSMISLDKVKSLESLNDEVKDLADGFEMVI